MGIRAYVIAFLVFGLAACEPKPDWQPERFKLDNGLEVVLLEDHRAPVVTHMVWYRVGSADDPAGKSGLAHFLEHLMFKGTAKLAPGEFSKIVAQEGGTHNAFTTNDVTAYYQKIARDRLEHMMEIEADRMRNLRLNVDDVLTEREVVREERRQRIGNPEAELAEQMRLTLYADHPYGIPAIGYDREIAELTRDDALDFYKAHYAPNNAILLLAGNITRDDAQRLAEKYYGPIPAAKGGHRDSPAISPLAQSERLSLNDSRVRVPSLMRMYVSPTYTTSKGLQAHAIDLAAEILGGGRSSRLYRELVDEQRIAVQAAASSDTGGRLAGTFYLQAIPAEGADPAELEAAVDKVVNQFLEHGPTDDEMNRAAQTLAAAAIYARDSQMSMAQVFGASRAVGEPIEHIANWPDDILKPTAEDVRLAAKSVLDQHSVTGWLMPLGQAAP